MAWAGEVVLIDTTSVIGFLSEAEQPGILKLIASNAQRLEIPHRVRGEVRTDDLQVLEKAEGVEFIDKVDQQRFEDLEARHPFLGDGELSVIVRALHLGEENVPCWCILDDEDAREVAEHRGLRLTGAVGLLETLESERLLTRQDHCELLRALRDGGFWYDWDDPSLPIN